MIENSDVLKWVEECRKSQPAGTIGIFLTVDQGKIHCLAPFEMKQFPTDDLSAAAKLVAAEFRKAIARGPSDE